MRLPGPRDIYNFIERSAAPLANDVTRSDEFAQVVSVALGLRSTVRNELNRLTARVWHTLNLPVGTDLQSLRSQVGSLDRDIRLLTFQLSQERDGEVRDSGSTASADELDRPGSS